MKKLTLGLLVSALVLSGCGSTSNNTVSEPVTNLKALEVASMEEYNWDDDKSFAFNLARLSNPAGVGYGMSDSVNPKGTDLGRSESSLLSGVTGFMVGGLGSAAGFLSMDSDSNAKRDWNTSIITFYDEDEIDLNDPISAKNHVTKDVSEKLVKSLQYQYPDTALEGTFTQKKSNLNNSFVVISGSVCEKAFEFGRLDDVEYDRKDSFGRLRELIVENTSNISDGCVVLFNTKVSGKVNGKLAVVAEMLDYSVNTFIVNAAGANIENAYIMYPDRSIYFAIGSRLKHYFPYPYPLVAGKGKEFLLDSKQTSSVQMID
ncbi:MAG: hypothetical protein ACI9T7_000070 [Oleiphilaceae bacterium]|jgi:hypothetical protein